MRPRGARVRLLPALFAIVAALAAPSAGAWACASSIHAVCEHVNGARDHIYETTGILVDVVPSSEGIGVTIIWAAGGHSGSIPIVVCVRDTDIWYSRTGCDTPASGSGAGNAIILP